MLKEESNPSFHFTYLRSSLFLFDQTNAMEGKAWKIPHSLTDSAQSTLAKSTLAKKDLNSYL